MIDSLKVFREDYCFNFAVYRFIFLDLGKNKSFCSLGSQQTFVDLQDVLETSSRRLQQNNFTSSKTSFKHQQLARRLEVVLEEKLIVRLKMSWRPANYLLGRNIYLYLTNLNLHLTNLSNKYISNKSNANSRQIQYALIRT